MENEHDHRKYGPETDEAQDSDVYEGPSKSQRKRDSTALQKLGEELVELSRDRLLRIDMPDNLRAALLEAQRITAHGGRKRQLQYIGKLMRQVDATPLREALDVVKGVSAAATAHQKRLEKLRERLLADESVLGEIAREFTGADISHLRTLRRNALKEAELGKPPRAFRELFRQLRELAEQRNDTQADTPETSDNDA